MRLLLILILLTAIAACGGSEQTDPPTAKSSGTAAGGLTPAQLENGIGPIDRVSLDEINDDLADFGEEVFEMKCSACHKLDARYVGPALGDVLERRTPEYVMNMILNPEQMVQQHPEARAMLAEFMTPMPNQQLTQDEARAVLEYLRDEAEDD